MLVLCYQGSVQEAVSCAGAVKDAPRFLSAQLSVLCQSSYHMVFLAASPSPRL